MTDTFYPDVSQYTPVSLAGAPIAIARATIGNVKDFYWDRFVADADAHGVPLYGYCFLSSDTLGVNAEAQADFAFSVVGTRPVMLDHEPNRGACASLSMSTRWIDRFRSHGGIVNIDYLPRWAWSGQLGSPDLAPLRDRGISLVSSNYTAYSDSGPGWAPYGGMTPVIWQYTDAHPFGGGSVDYNAYRGTVDQLRALISGGPDMNWADQISGTNLAGRTYEQVLADLEELRCYLMGETPANPAHVPATDSPLGKLLSGQSATLTDAQMAALVAAMPSAADVASHVDLTALAKALVAHVTVTP